MNEHTYLINIERSILSCFFFNPSNYEKVGNKIFPSSFYMLPHQAIFLIISQLVEKEIPIDEEFVLKQFSKVKFHEKTNNLYENVDLETALLDILSTNAITNLDYYVSELQKAHIEREAKLLSIKLGNNQLSIPQFKRELEKIENLYKEDDKKEVERDLINYDLLPPFLSELIRDLIKVNDYPPSMVLSTVLTSMAGLIGARAKITNGINLTVFPVIWSMIIAPSSVAAKSTLFRFSKKCVFDDMQSELFDTYESDLEIYKEDLKRFNALPKEDKQREIEPERPYPKLLIFANDGTPEAKILSLHRNQNGGVVYYDEMKAELERSNNDPRYKALKTSIFDGETYHKELVRDGGTFILRNPILSEIGLITEQWLMEAVQKNDIASGFMARYLFSYNQRSDFKPLQITKHDIDFDKYSNVGRFILECLEIDRKEPLLFELDLEARKYYVNWFNDFSRTAFAVETDEEITASYRLSTYVLKFALILHIFGLAYQKIDFVNSNMTKVNLQSIKSAIYLMEIFQNENHKILSLFEKNKKLNFKIDDIAIKLKKKISATETKMITKSKATNGIRGLTTQKLEEFINQGLFVLEKIDRTTYIKEA